MRKPLQFEPVMLVSSSLYFDPCELVSQTTPARPFGSRRSQDITYSRRVINQRHHDHLLCSTVTAKVA